jgi:hypothetical protein
MTTSKIDPSDLTPEWEQTGKNSWVVTLQEDGDDLVMPIPDELLAAQGWAIGDTLVWDVRDDGTIFLTKQ